MGCFSDDANILKKLVRKPRFRDVSRSHPIGAIQMRARLPIAPREIDQSALREHGGNLRPSMAVSETRDEGAEC